MPEATREGKDKSIGCTDEWDATMVKEMGRICSEREIMWSCKKCMLGSKTGEEHSSMR